MFCAGLCHLFAFVFVLLHCTCYKLLFPKVLCSSLSEDKNSIEIVTKGSSFGSFFDPLWNSSFLLHFSMPLTINKTILKKLSFSWHFLHSGQALQLVLCLLLLKKTLPLSPHLKKKLMLFSLVDDKKRTARLGN